MVRKSSLNPAAGGRDGPPGFRERFLAELLRDGFGYVAARDHEHPYPERIKRDGRVGRWALATRGAASNLAMRLAHATLSAGRGPWVEEAARELVAAGGRLELLESAYATLADEPSRELFVKLVEWRVLGPRHVRLPVSPDEYRKGLERVHRALLREPATRTVRDPYFPVLNRYEVAVGGDRLTVETDETCMLNTFVLDQYAYAPGAPDARGAVPVAVEAGDVVLDGGGGYGETVLEFAARAGPEGSVVCLEMDERNRRAIERNLELNPALADRVRVVDAVLWDESGVALAYVAGGKMSRVIGHEAAEGAHLVTTTIDDLAAREGIERVDFLKLDIEGSELRALRGAERTLRDHRPKLAIAAYHRPEDLFELPLHIHGLGLGYRLYLGHTSAEMDETVLFARV